ncbi:exported hypothetical protein [Agrobacterium genomosp. 2 str. CFBP 5494]|uniref:Uncharacterized protein n=1 Tax=Agrobacterium genomosp. 2 str. CFBP 5494 TaxID=1183436 RepID=A0A9W5AYF2_9HYPH|nr:exported hypothetical protein [Agrobacterium genomosp. 2 str. CFBP 5494]
MSGPEARRYCREIKNRVSIRKRGFLLLGGPAPSCGLAAAKFEGTVREALESRAIRPYG